MIKLSLRLVCLLLAVVCAGVLWQPAPLSILALGRIDPLPETRAMLAEGRYAEAADYLRFFMDYDYVKRHPEAQALHAAITSQRGDWRYQLDKLQEGLLFGTSDEAIGQAAGIATDFLVIGDLRDLAHQGLNFSKGEEIDRVLVALAALGVVATAAQAASAAATVQTGGVTIPAVAATTLAKSGLIALKTARKLGKLPAWLDTTIIHATKPAKPSKSLDALAHILSDVHTLARTRGGFKLLGQAHNATELQRMARFTETFGMHSATLYRIGGNVAIDVAQRTDKLGKETIKLAAVFGQDGLRVLDRVGALKFTKRTSRALKIGYKPDIWHLLAGLLIPLPTWLLSLFILLGVAVWVPWRMLASLGQRLPHGPRQVPEAMPQTAAVR